MKCTKSSLFPRKKGVFACNMMRKFDMIVLPAKVKKVALFLVCDIVIFAQRWAKASQSKLLTPWPGLAD